MITIYFEIYRLVNFHLLALSVLLFFIGYALAPTAHYKKIKWLTAYPFFMIKLMEKYFKIDWPPLKIFTIIFCLNTLSLFVNLLSAWGVITPYFFVIYLGLNIGIIMYHNLRGHFYYASLFNPVALLELPAAWISVTMAIQFSLKYFFKVKFLIEITFTRYILYFSLTVIPLLLLAAILETFLIILSRKKSSD